MRERVFCGYCGEELDLGQQFLRELEAAGVDSQFAPMVFVQSAESPYGAPLPICAVCRKGIEANQRAIDEELELADVKSRWTGCVFIGIGLLVLLFSAFAYRL